MGAAIGWAGFIALFVGCLWAAVGARTTPEDDDQP